MKGIEPCVKNWKAPITLARHAYGDVYKNTEINVPGNGNAELVFTAEDGTEIKGLVKMLDAKYNPDWEEARFLGRGTVTVSQIFYTSPSRCAVADSCSISLDRRMTFGETWESCLDEIRALPSVKKYGDDVKVSMYNYDRPSSTNGVSIMGRNGIPCIGFGPGAEAQAHAPNEKTWKQDLVTCAAVYAALPAEYFK